MRPSGSSLLWQYLEGWCARLSSMNMQPHLKHTNKIDGIWHLIQCTKRIWICNFGRCGCFTQVVKIWDICHHLKVRSRANRRIRCPGAAGPSESTPRRTLQTVGFSDEIDSRRNHVRFEDLSVIAREPNGKISLTPDVLGQKHAVETAWVNHYEPLDFEE